LLGHRKREVPEVARGLADDLARIRSVPGCVPSVLRRHVDVTRKLVTDRRQIGAVVRLAVTRWRVLPDRHAVKLTVGAGDVDAAVRHVAAARAPRGEGDQAGPVPDLSVAHCWGCGRAASRVCGPLLELSGSQFSSLSLEQW
jgi:hypothetical protein